MLLEEKLDTIKNAVHKLTTELTDSQLQALIVLINRTEIPDTQENKERLFIFLREHCQPEPCFDEMDLIEGRVMISFEWIGEGIEGDYTGNFDDVPLLRFYICKEVDKKSVNSVPAEGKNWEQVDDASYCTQIPIDTPKDILEKLLKILMIEFYPEVKNNKPVKKLAEKMSWINESWIKKWEAGLKDYDTIFKKE